jgi:hypothetical protein
MRGVGAIPRVSGEYRIIAPRSAGRELDELDLDFIADGDGLELECMPSSHRLRDVTPPPMLPPALAPRELSVVRRLAVPPPSSRSASASHNAIDPHAALVAFAGFGDPPAGLWGAPAYAMRVIERRRVLRAALHRARSLRSQDVGLYEAALDAADPAAVRRGIILTLGTVAIVLVICALLITDVVPHPW